MDWFLGKGDPVATADSATQITPLVSDARDITETLTGKDAITGEQLTTGQRIVTAGGALVLFIPAKPLRKKLCRGGEIVEDAADTGKKIVTRIFDSFDEFVKGRDFFDDAGKFDLDEARKAWEVYQRSSNSQGLIIGKLDDTYKYATGGWDVLLTTNWSPEINRAWLDGAIDAGLPVKLVSLAEELATMKFTRWEIGYLLSRGYVLRNGIFVPK